MKTAGIICEYNPFHAGHRLQIEKTRALLGDDTGIVCLMSGNFVQRGEPAIYPKENRAKAAILGGADLVLELPITAAVNSAGFFASLAVQCLHDLGCVDVLSFGSELGELSALQKATDVLCGDDFESALRDALSAGKSYAAARSLALSNLGSDGDILRQPNNALAVDYLCALKRLNSPIQPLAVLRDMRLPSASELREVIDCADDRYLPFRECYAEAEPHTLAAGERAMLAILRRCTDAEFETMPFGSEGLWSKVMKACRTQPDLNSIITFCKSKRYTHSRLRRMLLCLCLGLCQDDLAFEIPYLRVLAFNDRGRQLLRMASETSGLPLISGSIPHNAAAERYFRMEARASDLYPLFSTGEYHCPVGLERARHPLYVQTKSQGGGK